MKKYISAIIFCAALLLSYSPLYSQSCPDQCASCVNACGDKANCNSGCVEICRNNQCKDCLQSMPGDVPAACGAYAQTCATRCASCVNACGDKANCNSGCVQICRNNQCKDCRSAIPGDVPAPCGAYAVSNASDAPDAPDDE